MELSLRLVPVLAIALVALILPVYGQINTPCTASTLAVFTPCMNFLTNSSVNGSTPSGQCCNVLKNLTSNGKDCLCLIATGGIPFQIPINQTLAISLPRACNMPSVPLQCKAAGAPIPAPGPVSLGAPPSTSPQASPVVPEPTPSATSPESDAPPSPDVDSGTGVPTTTPGSRPVLTPSSAAMPTSTMSPSLLLFALGFLLLK